MGEGVTIDLGSVAFTGDDLAAGTFAGGEGIVGFEDGIILSSGEAGDVVGPNQAPNTQTNHGTGGDGDLTALSGFPTFDAAILEFEFEAEPDAEQVFFQYVFGSEEYNEYVATSFNDVFAFWVNGENCAVVSDPDDPDQMSPVSINTINNGVVNGALGQAADPTNPELYINNDPFRPDSTGTTVPPSELRDTEMDGLTAVLTCAADVQPGTNSMRLAIADAGDAVFDSWVLIQAGSLTTTPPVEADCVDLIAGQNIVAGEVCVANDGDDVSVTYTTIDGWLLAETHLAMSSDEPGSGEWTDRNNRWQNRQGMATPGRFPYQATHDPGVDEFSYVVPLADISGGVDPDTLLYIAAHAAVVMEDLSESAWGNGDRFVEQGDWAMYFTYTVQ